MKRDKNVQNVVDRSGHEELISMINNICTSQRVHAVCVITKCNIQNGIDFL